MNSDPLTTDDEYTHHTTLGACNQLAQSVLKTGFVLAKGWDWGSHDMPYRWQLSWAVERPWLALARPFLSFLAETGIELLCLCRGSISGSFQSGKAFAGWTALTIISSLMSGCG